MNVVCINISKDKKTLETLNEEVIEYTEVDEAKYYRPLICTLYNLFNLKEVTNKKYKSGDSYIDI